MRARLRENPAVWSLIIITAVVFVIDMLTGRAITLFGAKSSLVWSGEYHRLFLATFLHGGLTHIVFNLYALYIFGQVTERLLGVGRFLALYLISGVTGYVASLLAAPGVLAVGASASIFGLMGYTLHFRLRRMPLQWSSIDAAFVQIIGLNVLIAFMVPNIDQWAHLGGFLGGALCGSLLGLERRDLVRRFVRPRETAAAAVVLAVVLFIGLRPLDAAEIVTRFRPSLGASMHERYAAYFLPFRIEGPTVFWRYMDVEGDWDPAGEQLLIDERRPVALSIFWRWGRGGGYQPNAFARYEVIWRQDGLIVDRTVGDVWDVDEQGYIYLKSATTVMSGASLTGNWTISVHMLDTTLITLEVKVMNP